MKDKMLANTCISWWALWKSEGYNLYTQGTDVHGTLVWPSQGQLVCMTAPLNKVSHFTFSFYKLKRLFSCPLTTGVQTRQLLPLCFTASVFLIARQTILPENLFTVNVKTCTVTFFFFSFPSWKPPGKQAQRLWETWPRDYLKSTKHSLKKLKSNMRTVHTSSRYLPIGWIAPRRSGPPFWRVKCETSNGNGRKCSLIIPTPATPALPAPGCCQAAVLAPLPRALQSAGGRWSMPPCLEIRAVPGDPGQWLFLWFCLGLTSWGWDPPPCWTWTSLCLERKNWASEMVSKWLWS